VTGSVDGHPLWGEHQIASRVKRKTISTGGRTASKLNGRAHWDEVQLTAWQSSESGGDLPVMALQVRHCRCTLGT